MEIIKRIKIKNFKILKDIDIKLSNLTLITGANSSGKSSFIQALLILKQNEKLLSEMSFVENLLDISKREFQVNGSKNNTKNLTYDREPLNKKLQDLQNQPIEINGAYTNLGKETLLFSLDSFKEDIEITLASENKIFKFCIKQFTRNKKDEKDFSALNLKIKSDIKLLSLLNIFTPNFQYLRTDRISPEYFYPLSAQAVSLNNIGNSGEYTAHFLEKNRREKIEIDKLKHPSAKTNQLLESISLWLAEISSNINVSVSVDSSTQKARLSYSYNIDEQRSPDFSPFNVGFGLTYVLPIIVSILKAKPNELLIIENPESHLHSKGQSVIAKLCALAAANGVQIIIETHSDHFLNSLRVATKKAIIMPEQSKIYFFEKDTNNLTANIHELSIDKNGKINENWPKGFFDEFENNLDQLLW